MSVVGFFRPPAGQQPVLRLRYGAETMQPEPLGTIVEGLLHRGSVTLVYGPPKSGKSFLMSNCALSIAAAERSWMGRTIHQPGPVLYVACEGHAGFWKRMAAEARQRNWDDAAFPEDFILATGRPKLIRADDDGWRFAPDPSSIMAALEELKTHNLNPVAIIIDTVFRSFGAGNVNASTDMNVYLAAITTFADRGHAVVLIHHEIKSGGTPAGSVSLIGGADTIAHVWRTDEDGTTTHFWQVEMAKDDSESQPRAFSLKVVDLGTDPDGINASSCMVEDAGLVPNAVAQEKHRAGRPKAEPHALSPKLHAYSAALRQAIAIFPTRPDETTKDAWLAEAVRTGLIETPTNGESATSKNKREAPFRSAVRHLRELGIIEIDQDLVHAVFPKPNGGLSADSARI